MKGALLTSLGYIVVGAPISTILCYNAGLGLNGIWIGAIISSIFLVIGYHVLIERINWEEIFENLKALRAAKEVKDIEM